MSYLLIGDLHLSDRPRDAYRFNIFKWALDQQDKLRPRATFLMGDLTDQKDRHSASLVNKIIDSVIKLRPPVFILKGNHDYVDPSNPFFKFLSKLEGVSFVVEPRRIFDGIVLIPHIRSETDFDHACRSMKPCSLLLLHNTFQGAIAETGAPLSGFSASPIEFVKPAWGCYAGDAHKPQRAGPVTYVGAPYNIRFGDNFTPRCLFIDSAGKSSNLYFDSPRKWKLLIQKETDILNDSSLLKGDQVKIELVLPKSETVHWKTHRQRILDACKSIGLDVFGIALRVVNSRKQVDTSAPVSKQPADVVSAFCVVEKTPKAIKDAGLALL